MARTLPESEAADGRPGGFSKQVFLVVASSGHGKVHLDLSNGSSLVLPAMWINCRSSSDLAVGSKSLRRRRPPAVILVSRDAEAMRALTVTGGGIACQLWSLREWGAGADYNQLEACSLGPGSLHS